MRRHISSLGHAQGVVILMPQSGLWYIRKQGLKSECFSQMEFADERKTIESLNWFMVKSEMFWRFLLTKVHIPVNA